MAMMASMLITACTVPKANISDVGQWKIPMSLPKEFKHAPSTTPKTGGYSYVVRGQRYYVKSVAVGYRETGIASWYGGKFHGRLTANQETYDMYRLTAAHKSLPLPSYIRVLNHNNGKSVIVRVNDRGPFIDGRIVDLSFAAAEKIGMAEAGLAPVTIEVIDPPVSEPTPKIFNALSNQYIGYIQVGSYKEIANASRVVHLLKQQNLVPRLGPASYRSGGTDIHYVRLGPFNTRQELDAAGELLNRNGFTDYQTFHKF